MWFLLTREKHHTYWSGPEISSVMICLVSPDRIADLVHFTGRGLRRAARKLMDWRALSGVWFDVGAHSCHHTYPYALINPSLKVYAFEPNLRLVARMFNALPNICVVPMAVAEQNGSADFHITEFSDTSSLLQIDESAVPHWKGGWTSRLSVAETITVPTIRLDTFMELAGIKTVDYLKIDAQGMDLAVVRSAGARLKDISRIHLEVCVHEHALYRGACTKLEVLEYMKANHFELVAVETQTDGQEENLTFEKIAVDRRLRLPVSR